MTECSAALTWDWTLSPIHANKYPWAQTYFSAPEKTLGLLTSPSVSKNRTFGSLPPFQWTKEEAEDLAAWNRDIGNPAGADLAFCLVDSQTVTIVTGQQPNLLAAPAYNLAKALGVIERANNIRKAEPTKPVVPIFWIAGDDTDFEELRQFFLPDSSGLLHPLGNLVTRGEGRLPGSPASTWTLDAPAAERMLEAATQIIGPSSGRQSVLEELRELLALNEAAPPSYETLFVKSLLQQLSKRTSAPLLFLPSHCKALRRAAIPLIIADLEVHREVAELIVTAGHQYLAQGWKVPLQRPNLATNFFYHSQDQRLSLQRSPSETNPTFLTKAGHKWTKAELVATLDQTPEYFSPGVVLRPLVQDYALRPKEYLAGPGELAYLIQCMGPTTIYQVPRATLTLRPRWSFSAPDAHDTPLVEHPLHHILQNLEQEVQQQLLEARALLDASNEKHAILTRAIMKTQNSWNRNLNRLRRNLDKQLNQNAGERDPLLAYLSRVNDPVTPERFLPIQFVNEPRQ